MVLLSDVAEVREAPAVSPGPRPPTVRRGGEQLLFGTGIALAYSVLLLLHGSVRDVLQRDGDRRDPAVSLRGCLERVPPLCRDAHAGNPVGRLGGRRLPAVLSPSPRGHTVAGWIVLSAPETPRGVPRVGVSTDRSPLSRHPLRLSLSIAAPGRQDLNQAPLNPISGNLLRLTGRNWTNGAILLGLPAPATSSHQIPRIGPKGTG